MFPMPNKALVERLVPELRNAGSFRNTYASHLTDVPCRFQEGAPKDIVGAAAEKANLIGTAYFSPDVDVRRGDRVTIRGVVAYAHGTSTPSVGGVYLKVILESEQATAATQPPV